MTWTEVRVRAVEHDARDFVVAALVDAGALGVQELDADLLTHLQSDSDFGALERAIRLAGSTAVLERRDAGDIDWSNRWPTRVGVQRLGRIAVAPPWLAADIADAECPVIIEPATAFGTGEHESTRGVLRLMQRVIRPNDVVADLGAGSAVLSIAAVRLGASRVAAIELEGDAIANAEANVVANGVDGAVTVVEGDAAVILPLVAPVRVVLANIISSVLLDLEPVIRAALLPDGRVIMSGMLTSEREPVLRELGARGWSPDGEDCEGDWWSVIARR